VFFFPDRLMAIGMERPCVPKFIPVPNSHEPADERRRYFAFDFQALENAVRWAYVGAPSGFVQLWHSHLEDLGPSIEDFEMVGQLDAALSMHPIWAPTRQHKIFTVAGGTWYDYTADFSTQTEIFTYSANQGPDA